MNHIVILGNSGERSLEDIEDLLKVDTKFHLYYLMRANHFISKSDNPEIRKCEIKHAVNRIVDYEPRENLRLEVQRKLLVFRELSQEKHVGEILKDLEKALEIFEKEKRFVIHMKLRIEECEPTSSFEHALLGERLFATGGDDSDDKITASFNRSLDLNPKNYFALVRYSEYCKALSTAGGNRKGMYFLLQALGIEPRSYDAKYFVGMMFYNNAAFGGAASMFKDAVDVLLEVCEMDSYFFDALLDALSMVAMCNARLREFELAVRFFNNAIDLITKNPTTDPNGTLRVRIVASRGKCFLQQGRFEESILDLTTALNSGYGPARELRQEVVDEWKKKIMKS